MKKVVKTLESRMKASRSVAFISFLFNLIICIVVLIYANGQVDSARKSIYVLNGNIPMLASQTLQEVNRPAEYRSQIDLFHSLFFNIMPDEKQIQLQMEKALYLSDESGMQQYHSLKEKGFFSSILSSNAFISLMTDSIVLDNNKNFVFYGKQKIERRTSITIRNLVTSGSLLDVPRTINNSHGVQIINWKTLNNEDLSFQEKYTY